MAADDPRPVSVRGGVAGIHAHFDDMLVLARLFGQAATDLAALVLRLHGYLFDPGLAAGDLVDPAAGLEFEVQLGLAVDGPEGLTWIAARCGLSDVKLRTAAAAYQLEDDVLSRVKPFAQAAIGLPDAFAAGATAFVRTGNPAAGVQPFVTADPALADAAVAAVGGVDGAAAHVAAKVMVDGAPTVTRVGLDPAPLARTPPRSVHDLMAALALRDEARHGAIDVRILTRPDGTRAAIVDIPGTKSWQPLPNGDITSLSTNLRAVRGATTGYERGVLLAMEQAGVRPTDEVMMVGHSLGGMVAVQTAIAAHASGRFRVTHVVTAGAPIGAMTHRIPPDVEVLALENEHDVVPHVDGRENDDRINVTTVTFSRDAHAVVANHTMTGTYLPAAGAVDASRNASIRTFLASASGFFAADGVRTERFVITRAR